MNRVNRIGLLISAASFALFFSACNGCGNTVSNNGTTKENCKGVKCAENEDCVEGVCTATGDRDPTPGTGDDTRIPCNQVSKSGMCKSGLVCENGVCYGVGAQPPTCAPGINGTCADSGACVNGACTPITPENACTNTNPSGLCPGGEACVAGTCYPDDGKLFCSPARLNGYCPNNGTCVEGVCQDIPETCSVTTPMGSCSSWETCVQGQCVGPTPPDACGPSRPAGVCPAQQVCLSGTCTPLTETNACSPSFPNGLCPPGSACQAGDCIDLTPENTCSAEVPAGLCPGGAVCRDGVCVASACQNGGLSCPPDQVCSMFTCVPMACDPAHPTGACVDPEEACDHGLCVEPSCSLTEPDGVCPPNQFCFSGTCVAVTCNVSNPTGTCPTGQRCEAGTCRLLGCADASNPNDFCAPDVCDLQNNVCQAPLCNPGPGRCLQPGRVCRDEDSNGNTDGVYQCAIPPCGPGFPGGLCPVGQVCATQAGVTACVDSPCGIGNQYGDCPAGSGRICCNSSRVYVGPPAIPGPPYDQNSRTDCGNQTSQSQCNASEGCMWNGTTCVASAVTFEEQGQCAPQFAGQCVRKNCGDVDAEHDPTGYCPPGFLCADTIAPAGYSCEAVVCSPSYPNAPCDCEALTSMAQCTAIAGCSWGTSCTGTATEVADLCKAGACIAICGDNSGPRGDAHLIGACPGNFVCINSNCAPPCTVTSSCAVGDTRIICTRDSDCDGRSDEAEGAEDDNNDGVLDPDSVDTDDTVRPATASADNIPDAFDVDSDNDGVLDRVETKLPSTCTSGNAQPWRNIDCDGDFISDSIEARPSGASGLDPVSVPVDTNGDGTPDMMDDDSDGDGILDICEGTGDCTPAAIIVFPVSGLPPAAILNTDRAGGGAPVGSITDALPNYRDTDADGDGIADSIEARVWPWLAGSVPGNVTGGAPANHDATAEEDYIDFDSDGDGVFDVSEDLDGDGIIDCQLGVASNGITYDGPDGGTASDCVEAGLGNAVINGAVLPACATYMGVPNYGAPPGASSPYYNPLCGCSNAVSKCFFAESSRVHTNTDGDTIPDATDGTFIVCSAENLKPINVFPSQAPDYSLALEQSFTRARMLTDTSSVPVGMAVNDPIFDNNVTITGSNAVAGFILARRPDNSAILVANSPPDDVVPQRWVTKAVAQEVADRNVLRNATGSTQLNLLSLAEGVTVVITRNLPSYDGFGNVLSRYRIRTAAPMRTSLLRDRILKVLMPTVQGLPAETVYTAAATRDQEGGAEASDFILFVQHLYRTDTGDPATTAGNVASETGRVLLLAALVPSGDIDTPRSFNYRSQCARLDNPATGAVDESFDATECPARVGCVWGGSSCLDRATYCAAGSDQTNCNGARGTYCQWDATNNVCKERREYQIPLFFADNITNGSAVTQYGDELDNACEIFKQKLGRFDFLWTIDDSGSMDSEIDEVRDSATDFARLVDLGETDYRLASISTDHSTSGWKRNWGNANLGAFGDDAALPRRWSDNSGTSEYTGKIQGLCSTPSTDDRTTNASCAAAPYFSDRLPPDVDGSGAEFSMGITLFHMYRYGPGANECGQVNTHSAGARSVDCRSVDKCSASGTDTQSCCTYNAAQNFCYAPITACADVNKLPAGERSAACGTLTQCSYNATAGACYENFCSHVTSAYACEGPEFCDQFKGSANVAACARYAGQGCAAGPNDDCVSTLCMANADKTSCNASRNCRWDEVSNYCNDLTNFSCNLWTSSTPAVCNAHAAQGCGYFDIVNNTTDDCVSNKCRGKGQTDCQASIGCTWRDPSGASNNYCDDSENFNSSACNDILVNSGAGQTTCNSTPGCAYRNIADNTQDDCVSTTCNSINGTSNADRTCADTPGCVWRDPPGNNNNYCDDLPNTIQSQPELIGCEWSPTYNACVPSMPQLCRGLGQTECSGAYNAVCNWNTGADPDRCDARFNGGCNILTQTQCAARAPTCQWLTDHCERDLSLPFSMCDGLDSTQCATRTANECEWVDTVDFDYCRPKVKQAFRNDTNVKRVLVAVTDEEECYLKDKNMSGDCEWAEYNRGIMNYTPASDSGPLRAARTLSYMRFLQGRGFTVFAITGDKANEALASGVGNGGCNINGNGADPNNTIINVSEQTGGAWGTICPSDLYPTIESIVLQVLGSASPYILTGPGQPISATIKVAVEVCNNPAEYPNCTPGGTKMIVVPRSRDNGFDYDATSKSILFYGDARPKNDGDIVVSYRYWVDTTLGPPGTCPCAGATAPDCNCPTAGEVCSINAVDFCNGASAAECPSRSVTTPSNCSFVAGQCQHECRLISNELGCNANEDCYWNDFNNRCEISYCSEALSQLTCGTVAGCFWNTAFGTNGKCVPAGFCATDPTCGDCPDGGVCDPTTGQCVCEAACDGSCPGGQTCDPLDTSGGLCGTCKCPACPGTCPQGTYCDATTCGQCVCDQTCRSCTSEGCTPTGCEGTYVCDSNQNSPTCGICLPPSCEAVPCPFGQTCIQGSCVCDTTCGATMAQPNPCPPGSVCDSSPTSQTCGQCQCDITCGGIGESCGTDPDCGGGLVCTNGTCTCPLDPGTNMPLECDTNPASPKCGTCRTPVMCDMCPQGQVCDLGVGQCVCDVNCGGCDPGFSCDTSICACVPGQCPPSPATMDPAPPAQCTAANLNCCFGSEGLSPYDNDFDGHLGCDNDCGRTLDYCGGDPCDTNDNNPNIP